MKGLSDSRNMLTETGGAWSSHIAAGLETSRTHVNLAGVSAVHLISSQQSRAQSYESCKHHIPAAPAIKQHYAIRVINITI